MHKCLLPRMQAEGFFMHNLLINESTELKKPLERLKLVQAKEKLITNSRHEKCCEQEGFHCIIYGQENEKGG